MSDDEDACAQRDGVPLKGSGTDSGGTAHSESDSIPARIQKRFKNLKTATVSGQGNMKPDVGQALST